jgi:hypothetical protein
MHLCEIRVPRVSLSTGRRSPTAYFFGFAASVPGFFVRNTIT